MEKLNGEEITNRSCDSVCSASIDGTDELYPTEFLNTLKFSRIPIMNYISKLDCQLCYLET
jgi:hypothetical protein